MIVDDLSDVKLSTGSGNSEIQALHPLHPTGQHALPIIHLKAFSLLTQTRGGNNAVIGTYISTLVE